MNKRKTAQAQCQHCRKQEPNAELISSQETNTKCRKRAALIPIEQQLEQQINIQQK
ncbi:17081_t:CDS:1, partial [Cetraspora pellucida]